VTSIGKKNRKESREEIDSRDCQTLTFFNITFDEYETSSVCLKVDRIFDSMKVLTRRLMKKARKFCLLKLVDSSRIVSSITFE